MAPMVEERRTAGGKRHCSGEPAKGRCPLPYQLPCIGATRERTSEPSLDSGSAWTFEGGRVGRITTLGHPFSRCGPLKELPWVFEGAVVWEETGLVRHLVKPLPWAFEGQLISSEFK